MAHAKLVCAPVWLRVYLFFLTALAKFRSCMLLLGVGLLHLTILPSALFIVTPRSMRRHPGRCLIDGGNAGSFDERHVSEAECFKLASVTCALPAPC
eukprot:4809628-Pleurochrysis_carterae.AAC.2